MNWLAKLAQAGAFVAHLEMLRDFVCLQLLLSQSTAEAYASLWYQLHHQFAFRDVAFLYEVVPVDFLEGAWSLAASSAV